ncbi:YicC/YloC family endoribonuclease [Ponticaulis sp.]|uniref:YicC/YloC family endoribonuclease n=1 Tax=Ponticaulis sp. TaxID=2020902 RepID=UPI000B7388AF|nr:YicC/YloC family endoribonuclease [Ponticaulis sp.]MAI91957.1 YicC family protein [Ponticaulis sp.]OUX96428.1 MAG: YicC family protein [Hyphomonadaceae bacterium TMED5]|tara:strand:+ start:33380 stop:34264 length:885 start_codon:yes stop_codon:yes gene_type:complete
MLSSMTGFGSALNDGSGLTWTFEVKSVNGRGLDVRLYLPTGCESLEAPIRAAFKSAFSRGNMQANLNIRETSDAKPLSLDTRLLNALSRKARMLDRQTGLGAATSAGDLLALRGVMSNEKSGVDVSADSQTGKAILKTVSEAIEQLKVARLKEGESLASVLTRTVKDMETVVAEAQETADVQPKQMLAKLKERVAALLEDTRISEERLEQEVAILVNKADVTEELDRLKAHLAEAYNLFVAKGPVGRKLDFLSQELLREANTLGSKSASLEMTRHSLALKSLIDQFKEQAANVE